MPCYKEYDCMESKYYNGIKRKINSDLLLSIKKSRLLRVVSQKKWISRSKNKFLEGKYKIYYLRFKKYRNKRRNRDIISLANSKVLINTRTDDFKIISKTTDPYFLYIELRA